ncbi:CopG family transcriptional regulator [Ferroplasma sp.]|uniref:CopG family transcriptional regulator n=1 Tax=Ferroplasma sp. TaxID=2591003 RepID=UPI00262A3AAD|nr:CopG family transcriptional regulator [Ferroplasma sp.]
MTMYTTISAKISKEEREELGKLGINPTIIIRKAVQEEIRKAKNREFMAKMKKVAPIISKLKLDEIVSDIKEDRER